MATVAAPIAPVEQRHDHLSGTPRAHAIDRWIFVFMAGWFIAIVLAGFIPDSLAKIAAVEAGERPPFPIILHVHAVLMGSFLLLLLAQTWLMATGRKGQHMRLGLMSMALVPAVVIAGIMLVPTTYHGLWSAAQTASPEARPGIEQGIRIWENITLLQIRVGILFPLFIILALKARGADAGLHKRMMILATAVPLPAGIGRIPWLPKTLPDSPLSADLYVLLAIAPMFLWDLTRNRSVHRAYWIWLLVALPFTIAVHALWDTPWWHATARWLMGV